MQRLRLQTCCLKSRWTVSLKMLQREILLWCPVLYCSSASLNQVVSGCRHQWWKWAVSFHLFGTAFPHVVIVVLHKQELNLLSPLRTAQLHIWACCYSSYHLNNVTAPHELKGIQIAGQAFLLQEWMQKKSNSKYTLAHSLFSTL